MALQRYQLYKNGKPEGSTCDNPMGPCYEYLKDPSNSKVFELDAFHNVIRRFTIKECREATRHISGYPA
jgi:hypothetical protein